MLPLTKTGQLRYMRWRFEYTDKPDKYGAWDDSAPEETAKAYHQSREGLIFAVIEAKDLHGVIHRIFECPGHDFCNFQWEVTATFGIRGGTGRHQLIGLSLVSRTHRATLYHNGNVEIVERDKDDLDNHYSYGKV